MPGAFFIYKAADAEELLYVNRAVLDIYGCRDEKEVSAVQTLPLDFSKMCLLLAEDNDINREIANVILTQAGFAVENADNGQVALEMVGASQPGYYDAVLMDIHATNRRSGKSADSLSYSPIRYQPNDLSIHS